MIQHCIYQHYEQIKTLHMSEKKQDYPQHCLPQAAQKDTAFLFVRARSYQMVKSHHNRNRDQLLLV